ncbi:hypothetical protein LEP1GSC034_1021 [Leptospira interrogans str. 2003000735]|uniref:Uncharacterized protein n=3 Tax=Leptospira interrogans TaxID=173 RepID=A0A829DC98_LEPIR|nr:hypothetical protein LEP1GSC027_3972 [Leptospira interrogans str. 2002000624]EKQ40251.1 hypothetical protein LEP1GSC025_2167 [Leptospira interrogans str. 2002000621]EKQ46114.1 hypothetical protein LEP1GSC026_3165 [Leptospira interrogans str. 2002000623]EMJ68721.1 hypothetical protein LEP1GSC034_0771 [Leptospira interrogans str. 2003000735]EMJ76838.1 hypothetical protein LEP1GSC032_0582 [Leptospira interrogans str. 2002000631]EMY06241.1 hypothetical protein LEP1GSC029_3158 [Leptospira interr
MRGRMNNFKPDQIKLGIKDVLVILGFVISGVIQYNTMYKDHEIRIVKIETEMTAIAKDLSEIKADVKDLIKLSSAKGRRFE